MATSHTANLRTKIGRSEVWDFEGRWLKAEPHLRGMKSLSTKSVALKWVS